MEEKVIVITAEVTNSRGKKEIIASLVSLSSYHSLEEAEEIQSKMYNP
jgi:hypothetical protein